MTSREEDAWRQIVDNYGERPTLPEDLLEPPPVAPPVAPSVAPPVPPRAREEADEVAAEERFVPPDPPPVPRPRGARLFAWVGVLGVPVLLVLSMILVAPLPPTLTTLLVVWFLGGFLWLVSQMPRQRDDPFDDGAVL